MDVTAGEEPASCALFGCVSLAALSFPAQRATKIDPLATVRRD